MSWFTSLAGEYPLLVYGAIFVVVTAFFAPAAFLALKSGTAEKDRLHVLVIAANCLCLVLILAYALWQVSFAIFGGVIAGIIIGILGTVLIKRERETALRPTPAPPTFD